MASDLKTSLGIWAMGGMVTRFVPVGYQPEHGDETTAQKVRRAVEGLGDLIDDYEFHYPNELSEDNLDEVRARLDQSGVVYEIKQFVRGQEASEEIVEAADRLNASLIVIGLRRRTPTGKLITGSQAQRILLDANVPVLAVKAPH